MSGSIDYGTSWVALCNRALGRLGKERISSLSGGGETVNLCNEFLGEAIESILSEFAWNAAKKRVQLAELASAPVYGFDHAYELPSDLVNIVAVDLGGADYRIEGTSVLTDESEVWITYIARPTDPKILPGYLKEAISTRLAALLVLRLSSSDSLAQQIKAEAQESLERAIRDDARRAPPSQRAPWYDEAR